jgi:hypothetical protein
MMKPGAKLLSISMNDTNLKSNYQYFQRYTELDMSITGDAEETLPSLIEACKRLITPDRRRVLEERGKKIAAANAQAMEQAKLEASYGWDITPISTRRMSAELWEVIKDKNWASVGGGGGRLLNVDKALPNRWRQRGRNGLWFAHCRRSRTRPTRSRGRISQASTEMAILCMRREHCGRQHITKFLSDPDAQQPCTWGGDAYHRTLRHQRGTDDMLNANAGIGTRLDSPNINSKIGGVWVFTAKDRLDPKDLGPACVVQWTSLKRLNLRGRRNTTQVVEDIDMRLCILIVLFASR